jgi:hypothetical protein
MWLSGASFYIYVQDFENEDSFIEQVFMTD